MALASRHTKKPTQNIAGAHHNHHHFVRTKDHILRGLPHCQVKILLIFFNKSEELAVPAMTLNATTNATRHRCAAAAAAATAAADGNDDEDNDDDNGIYLVRPQPPPHA